MFKNKIILILVSISLLSFSKYSYAADIYADETEKFTPIENKNMGLYIISKIVDAQTGKNLENVQIESKLEKTVSDKNGEFFIKTTINEYLTLKFPNYKETSIKVSDIRGKIKLELLPKYLPIFPNNQVSLSYRNLGFSESFKEISLAGKINDSFSVDASTRIFNNLYIGLGYESVSGIYNRAQTLEKASFSDNGGYLRVNWIYEFLKDRVDFAFGLKGHFKSIASMNTQVNQEDPRDNDYLDFNNQRLAIGPEIEIGARPVRYLPLTVGAGIAYYPYIIVLQDPNALLPKNLSGFDYNIYARYDFMNFYLKTKFFGTNSFQNDYNSSQMGVALSLGYGF